MLKISFPKLRLIPLSRSFSSAISHDWVTYIRTATDPKPKSEGLTLFGHNLCPFVERVRLALAEKEVVYNSVELDLTQRPDWYYEMNPSGQVPTIQFANGAVLYESGLILEVIDQIYESSTPSLFPKDPIANAQLKLKIRSLTKFIPLYYGVARMQDDWEQKADTLKSELIKLEAELGDQTFFGGDRLSALDLMIFPHLERTLWMRETHLKSNYELIGGENLQTLRAYYERVRELEHLKRAFAERRAHLSIIA